MIRLVYASTASHLWTEHELTALLVQARASNARSGVTGMLLYKDGAFLQVLEGETESVHEIFRRIEADRRHNGVQVLLEETIEQRDFPDWSMGFEKLEGSKLDELDGYAGVFEKDADTPKFFANLELIRNFLLLFKPQGPRLSG